MYSICIIHSLPLVVLVQSTCASPDVVTRRCHNLWALMWIPEREGEKEVGRLQWTDTPTAVVYTDTVIQSDTTHLCNYITPLSPGSCNNNNTMSCTSIPDWHGLCYHRKFAGGFFFLWEATSTMFSYHSQGQSCDELPCIIIIYIIKLWSSSVMVWDCL